MISHISIGLVVLAAPQYSCYHVRRSQEGRSTWQLCSFSYSSAFQPIVCRPNTISSSSPISFLTKFTVFNYREVDILFLRTSAFSPPGQVITPPCSPALPASAPPGRLIDSLSLSTPTPNLQTLYQASTINHQVLLQPQFHPYLPQKCPIHTALNIMKAAMRPKTRITRGHTQGTTATAK